MSERSTERDAFRAMVGARIRDTRKRKRLSQADVVAAADCSQSALSQYERGIRDPPFSVLVAIAQAIGTTPNALAKLS